MGIIKIPFFFFVFIHLVQYLIQGAEICPIQWCAKDEPTIRFPFTLKDRGSEKYSLLNCSSSIDILLKIITKLTHIRCLSSFVHTVIAVDVPTSSIAPLNTIFMHIADVPIPYSPFQKDVPVDLNENFVLSYPTCQKKSESDRKTILVLCLAIGLPNLLFVVGVGYIAYIACCRDNNSYGRR
ncbi:hypothetical protein C5167_027437 [Papaver somniferum]|nr:hypothetical protein C5167_027437 [Papaver somniferum]